MGGLNILSWRRSLPRRVRWESGRMMRGLARRFGVFAAVLGVCAAVILAASITRQQQVRAIRQGNLALESMLQPSAPSDRDRRDAEIMARLLAFDAHLVPYEDSALVLQDLIDQAKAQGLSLPRGEYVVLNDREGGFLRFRMTLPIKGRADAVPKFIVASLASQASLSLEAVQFKRERGVSQDVEARVQFALMTRLPRQVTVRPQNFPAPAGRKP